MSLHRGDLELLSVVPVLCDVEPENTVLNGNRMTEDELIAALDEMDPEWLWEVTGGRVQSGRSECDVVEIRFIEGFAPVAKYRTFLTGLFSQDWSKSFNNFPLLGVVLLLRQPYPLELLMASRISSSTNGVACFLYSLISKPR